MHQAAGIYDALTNFLSTLSADHPILWALLVVAVIVGSGLGLYAFWEAVVKAASAAFRRAGHTGRDSHP